nr:GNAT family N-acetyltransferase [Geomicrobium halophilum]
MKDNVTLSDLAYKSKAYWGYTDDFMEICKKELIVTKDEIKNNPVYLMERDHKIIAYYSFAFTSDPVQLKALFLDPDYIGHGLGKMIWKDILMKAKELNIIEFTIESDPHAEGFYQRMGAERIGDVPSTAFLHRKLPLMKVCVP